MFMNQYLYRLNVVKLSVLVLMASMLMPLAVAAQQTGDPENGQALEISPPLLTLEADPGATVKAQLQLRNVSQADLIVSAGVNDFVASGEGGTPKILLDEEEMDDNPYSLRDWVQPLRDTLLVPQEIKTLPITLKVPENASPGGHYGVVRFSASAPDPEDSGVSLSASLGTLMLVNVSGDVTESLEIAEFAVAKDGNQGTLFESAPLTFIERLENTGNTHLEPAGQVSITDMFGRKVAAVNVNLPPRNILPSSIRRFEQPLDSAVIGDKMLFGRYEAELNMTYGDSEQTVSDTITFWVIPYRLIIAVVTLLILGFFIIRFAMKRYNAHILEKAGASKSQRFTRKR